MPVDWQVEAVCRKDRRELPRQLRARVTERDRERRRHDTRELTRQEVCRVFKRSGDNAAQTAGASEQVLRGIGNTRPLTTGWVT